MPTIAQINHKKQLRALEARRDELIIRKNKAAEDLQKIRVELSNKRKGK